MQAVLSPTAAALVTSTAEVEEAFSDDERVVFKTVEVGVELVDCTLSTADNVSVTAVVGTATIEKAVLAEMLLVLEDSSASQESSVCPQI